MATYEYRNATIDFYSALLVDGEVFMDRSASRMIDRVLREEIWLCVDMHKDEDVKFNAMMNRICKEVGL